MYWDEWIRYYSITGLCVWINHEPRCHSQLLLSQFLSFLFLPFSFLSFTFFCLLPSLSLSILLLTLHFFSLPFSFQLLLSFLCLSSFPFLSLSLCVIFFFPLLSSGLDHCHASQTENRNLLLARLRCGHQWHLPRLIQVIWQVRVVPLNYIQHMYIHYKVHNIVAILMRSEITWWLHGAQEHCIREQSVDAVWMAEFTSGRKVLHVLHYYHKHVMLWVAINRHWAFHPIVVFVISDLTFTLCIWKNLTHQDIVMGQRATRSAIHEINY